MLELKGRDRIIGFQGGRHPGSSQPKVSRTLSQLESDEIYNCVHDHLHQDNQFLFPEHMVCQFLSPLKRTGCFLTSQMRRCHAFIELAAQFLPSQPGGVGPLEHFEPEDIDIHVITVRVVRARPVGKTSQWPRKVLSYMLRPPRVLCCGR